MIVGLGNPGPAHAGNRHNTGAWLLRRVAGGYGAQLRAKNKFFGETGVAEIGGREVRLLQPATFMNLSGRSVAAVCNFYQIEPQQTLIAHDEIDLEVGTIKFKLDGGHGGHNGLRSIIDALGGRKDFRRLRIGIGHPGHKSLVTGHVLGNPSAAEAAIIDDRIADAIAVLPRAAAGDWEEAMRMLHSGG